MKNVPQQENPLIMIETHQCDAYPMSRHDNLDSQAHEERHQWVTDNLGQSLFLSG
jgi:hypothetical protein